MTTSRQLLPNRGSHTESVSPAKEVPHLGEAFYHYTNRAFVFIVLVDCCNACLQEIAVEVDPRWSRWGIWGLMQA